MSAAFLFYFAENR